MSKPKTTSDMSVHDYYKAKHSNRIQENQAVKNKRKQNCKNKIYGFCQGYFVKDTRQKKIYKYVNVPEHTKEIKTWDHEIIINEDGTREHRYTSRVIGTKTIPAHTEKRIEKYLTIPTEPYLKRISVKRKKQEKDYASKKNRKSNVVSGKRAFFKKMHDIIWNIW